MVNATSFRFALAALLVACGGGTALVPTGEHPVAHQDYIPVEFPPPPAQIEEIPRKLDDQPDCAWQDGYYHWRGRWVWVPGRWVIPPDECYFAPPVVEWGKTRDAKLLYTPPRWYHDDADALPRSRALCPIPRPCAGTTAAGSGEQ